MWKLGLCFSSCARACFFSSAPVETVRSLARWVTKSSGCLFGLCVSKREEEADSVEKSAWRRSLSLARARARSRVHFGCQFAHFDGVGHEPLLGAHLVLAYGAVFLSKAENGDSKKATLECDSRRRLCGRTRARETLECGRLSARIRARRVAHFRKRQTRLSLDLSDTLLFCVPLIPGSEICFFFCKGLVCNTCSLPVPAMATSRSDSSGSTKLPCRGDCFKGNDFFSLLFQNSTTPHTTRGGPRASAELSRKLRARKKETGLYHGRVS